MEGAVSKYEIVIDGQSYVVEVDDVSASPIQVVVNGVVKTVSFREVLRPNAPVEVIEKQPRPAPPSESAPAPMVSTPKATTSGPGEAVKAPMPGKVLSITVAVGDEVSEGDVVCTIEAMKMEMPISSTIAGVVQGIPVDVGATVAYDDPLVIIS
jgi:biotin carboxyl carrier protein